MKDMMLTMDATGFGKYPHPGSEEHVNLVLSKYGYVTDFLFKFSDCDGSKLVTQPVDSDVDIYICHNSKSGAPYEVLHPAVKQLFDMLHGICNKMPIKNWKSSYAPTYIVTDHGSVEIKVTQAVNWQSQLLRERWHDNQIVEKALLYFRNHGAINGEQEAKLKSLLCQISNV
jgi:hypothetical protein